LSIVASQEIGLHDEYLLAYVIWTFMYFREFY